jgi:hypothetical protein
MSQPRSPQGTPTGGQFAEDRKPDGGDLATDVKPLPPGAVAGCTICERQGGGIAPRHFASKRCESGGSNHCSCDVCF